MSLRDYIGIPYQVRGTPPQSADCYSLVRHFAERELGLCLPPYMYSATDCYVEAAAFIADARRQMSTRWRKVEKQTGAVVVFRMMGLVMHCGIMVGETDFLHSIRGRDSTVESLNDFYWSKRVDAFYLYD